MERKFNIKNILLNNIVPIAFFLLTLGAVLVARIPVLFLLSEIVRRLSRNTFLVLALIIPVIAGLGLNFAIVLGAMAAQAALFFVVDWGITGLKGILLAMVIAGVISVGLGWIVGRTLNRAKGREMITSMILGFFANGVYQLIFLFFVGSLIPFKKTEFLLPQGVGLRNTVDLYGIVDSALNNIWTVNIKFITFYMVPLLIIVGLCLLLTFLLKTKLGQDFKAVGQDMHVAQTAGINVNSTRVTAIIISTVLAAIGQIIYLQDIGTINTYNSHEQIGLFSIAALLVGGASTRKANIWNAIIGVLLFHTLFIVAPSAGNKLFGQPQIGEFFREFIAYAVIAFALAMHGWKSRRGAH
ncbi:MAG: ABC transporter permease [Fervidobacterium sp.]|nr:ABC transporter permease [Fervidobacterium sp.]